jgi:hypothetical protein
MWYRDGLRRQVFGWRSPQLPKLNLTMVTASDECGRAISFGHDDLLETLVCLSTILRVSKIRGPQGEDLQIITI